METRQIQDQREHELEVLIESVQRDRANLHVRLEQLEGEDDTHEEAFSGNHDGKVYGIFKALWQ